MLLYIYIIYIYIYIYLSRTISRVFFYLEFWGVWRKMTTFCCVILKKKDIYYISPSKLSTLTGVFFREIWGLSEVSQSVETVLSLNRLDASSTLIFSAGKKNRWIHAFPIAIRYSVNRLNKAKEPILPYYLGFAGRETEQMNLHLFYGH